MSKVGSLKRLLQETRNSLTGYARRLFMARTVKEVFDGVAYRAEQELGWNCETVSKGLHELESGIECADGRRGATGRKPAEAHLPNLLTDIRDLVDSQSQTDARFRTQTWKEKHPVVRLVKQTYESGVRLSKQAMKAVEAKLSRRPHLPSWFIDIHYKPAG